MNINEKFYALAFSDISNSNKKHFKNFDLLYIWKPNY